MKRLLIALVLVVCALLLGVGSIVYWLDRTDSQPDHWSVSPIEEARSTEAPGSGWWGPFSFDGDTIIYVYENWDENYDATPPCYVLFWPAGDLTPAVLQKELKHFDQYYSTAVDDWCILRVPVILRLSYSLNWLDSPPQFRTWCLIGRYQVVEPKEPQP